MTTHMQYLERYIRNTDTTAPLQVEDERLNIGVEIIQSLRKFLPVKKNNLNETQNRHIYICIQRVEESPIKSCSN